MKPDLVVLRLVFGLFGLVGLGLLIGASFAISAEISFRMISKTGEGVVADLARASKGYKPVVEWASPDGKTYRFTGSGASSPPSYRPGEKVSVRYDPANPGSARIDSFTEGGYLGPILGGWGTIFTAISAAYWVHVWRKKKNREWLRAHGTRVQAKLLGVEVDRRTMVNGRSPWILSAEWQNPADNAIYTFKSDSIWFDPTEFVKRETLEVRVNPSKPSMYHIDLGFLPKHGG